MEFTFIPIVFLLSAFISVAVAVIAWRNRGVNEMPHLTLLLLAIGLYALTSAFEVASQGIPQKTLWMQFEYFGIAPIPPLFLAFAIAYTRWQEPWIRYVQMFAWFVTITTIFMVWTNGWHQFHWQELSLDSVTGNMLYDRGPWFPIWVGGAYMVLIVGTVRLLKTAFLQRHLFQTQSLLILFATLAPWIGNLLYLSDANPVTGLDWAPIAFTLTGLLLAIAILRYGLLSLLPVARSALVDGMSDGMIVVDVEGRVVDANQSALTLLNFRGKVPIGQPVTDEFPSLATELENPAAMVGTPLEFEVEGEAGPQVIEADVSPFLTGQAMTGGHLIIIRDITRRKLADRERELLITELQGALDQVRMLEGLLPVCSSCHNIRNDAGDWERMADYIEEHSSVEFSHSICPDCAKKLYPNSGLANRNRLDTD
ncbi:histidine kinase N-terminal 7TM domain-containing protein [Candidatus Zixiibacteriota bacterium]